MIQSQWQHSIESFPLSVGEVSRRYTKLPSDVSNNIFYHYTSHSGFEGIMRSGGLRATFRMEMNDADEFGYARKVVYEALDEIASRNDLPKVAQSLAIFTRKNLDQFLKDTSELSSAYCACLTLSSDHLGQWEAYAENGKGFAIGFNLLQFLRNQVPKVSKQEPHVFCAPVTYDENDQRACVRHLVEAGINDLQRFANSQSKQPEALTALRNRITKEIVVHLITLIDFIKAPKYSSERELRLILDPNDGTLKARNIQYYSRNNETIPFIFIDFRDLGTGLIPLAEIKIGPKASFSMEKIFVENLLNELRYNKNYNDWPQITHSRVA